jgi:hypothetical protein
VPQFQFITFQDPSKENDKAAKRLARSHAVKQALQNKRKLQQASMQNFCIRTVEDEEDPKRPARKGKRDGFIAPSLATLATSALDPFDTLPVKGSILQRLLNNCQIMSSSSI